MQYKFLLLLKVLFNEILLIYYFIVRVFKICTCDYAIQFAVKNIVKAESRPF